MSTIISSPFQFDSTATRDACVTALGLDLSLLGVDDFVTNTDTYKLLDRTTHGNKIILSNSASPTTLVVQNDTAGGFQNKDKITIIRTGAGAVTISQGVGSTLRHTETLVLRKQYSVVQLVRTAANTWVVLGDTAASDITEQPLIVGTQIDVLANNVDPAYVAGNNTTLIGQVSCLGTGVYSTYSTINFPYMYGCPAEVELSGITFGRSTSTLGSIDLADINDTTGLEFRIGISFLPMGSSDWIKAGVKFTGTGGGNIDAQLIVDNTLVGGGPYPFTTSNSIRIVHDAPTSTFKLEVAGSTALTAYGVGVLPEGTYTRLFLDANTTATTIAIPAIVGEYNGYGFNKLIRLKTSSNRSYELVARDLANIDGML